MNITNFKRFSTRYDISKIPANVLTGDSSNVVIEDYVVKTRKGFEYFGQEGEKDRSKSIHSEFVWKASTGGQRILRAYADKIQLKLDDQWTDLYTLPEEVEHVDFAKWVDVNTAIVKDRLAFVDGSDRIYSWNGGVAVIDSVNANKVTITDGKTLAQLGFDLGNTATQTVIINGQEFTYTQSDIDLGVLTLSGNPSAVAGDFVIAKPAVYQNARNLQDFNKDFIFNYKNQLITTNLETVRVYASDMTSFSLQDGFEYTIPVDLSNRTIATPYMLNLDAPITAIGEKRGVMRIFTADDIFRVTKTDSILNDYFVDVVKQDTAESIGAMPYAVANYKGDLIYIAKNKTLQNITDADTIHESTLKTLSKDINNLLETYDMEDCRIKYSSRYITLIIPKEFVILKLAMEQGTWQPPHKFPVRRISIVDDEEIGHSTSGNESYKLYSGLDDLGNEIDYKIEFGMGGMETQGYDLKSYEEIGFDIRMTENTNVDVETEFETGGTINSLPYRIEGINTKFFTNEDDSGLGANPLGESGVGDSTYENKILKRAMVFTKSTPIPFFNWRPIFSLKGKDIEFILLGFTIDVDTRTKITKDQDMYIELVKPKKSEIEKTIDKI